MPIALVSNVAKTSNGTSSGIDTTGASLIVVVVGSIWVSSAVGGAISDSNSNTWRLLGRSAVNASNCTVCIWYCVNPTVGAGHTFTVTNQPVGAFPSFCVAAFSGTSTTYVVDSQNPNNFNSSAASIQPGSMTPNAADSLIIAGFASRTTATIAVDSSFTITDQNPFSAGAAIGSVLAYKIQSGAASAENPTFSWTGNAVCCAMQVSAQPPGAGGGGTYTAAPRLVGGGLVG